MLTFNRTKRQILSKKCAFSGVSFVNVLMRDYQTYTDLELLTLMAKLKEQQQKETKCCLSVAHLATARQTS